MPSSARTSSTAGPAVGAAYPPSRRIIRTANLACEALRSAALIAEQRDIATRGQLGAGAKAIAEIPGAEVLKLAPSMRGDKRVAVRFNLAAREATDKIQAKPYVEQVKASDNLRWSLSGGMAAADDKPLGKAAARKLRRLGTATGSPE